MSITEKLRGVIPAVATPLTEERNIDVPAYRKHIRHILDAGCNGVMILGTAGEGVIVDSKNYALAVATAVEEVKGEYPVIVGAGGANYEKVFENISIAHKEGADAVLVVPHFYFVTPQSAIETFFKKVANESKLPVMIYNIPANTKVNVDVPTVVKLSKEENIVGMKDSSGDFVYFQRVIAYAQSDKFKIFQGRAPYVLASVLFGAAGTQCPVPNVAPELELGVHKAVQANNMKEAIALQNKMNELVKIFGYEGNPISTNLKGLMSALGICQKWPADCIPPLEDAKVQEYYQTFKQIMQS